MKSLLRSGLLVVAAACGEKSSDEVHRAPATLSLGDCVESLDAAFVSGPRWVASPDRDPTEGEGAGSGGGAGSGTFEYGTIGHRGDGYRLSSRTGGRFGDVPTIAIGQPTVQGDLDKAIVRRYIKRNVQKLQYCYEKELLVHPKLSGTVSTQFYIGPNGNVKAANAGGVNPNVAACVADVIKGIEFPKPKSGGVQVTYPFTFRFAGQSGPVAAAPKLPPLPAVGSDAEPPPAPPVAPSPPPPRDTSVAGQDSPLAAIQAAMKDCLARQPKAYGAFVVDLTFSAQTVIDAKAVGVDGAAATCIATAAKTITRARSGPAAQRCAVSFGDMPIADVPTIRITDKDVTFDGAIVDHPKSIFLDASDASIVALGKALEAWLASRAPSATTVPIRGPGLLEPIGSTPMRVVGRVIETTLASHADFVLAAQTDTTWRPLRAVHAPVVPVPVGTGRTWSWIPTGKIAPAADRAMLSVIVTQDQIWIGLAPMAKLEDVTGRDWALLEDKLAHHKASALFADREDLEIGADDAVSYGDVVKVIEIATKVGFAGWHVVPPARITTKPQP